MIILKTVLRNQNYMIMVFLGLAYLYCSTNIANYIYEFCLLNLFGSYNYGPNCLKLLLFELRVVIDINIFWGIKTWNEIDTSVITGANSMRFVGLKPYLSILYTIVAFITLQTPQKIILYVRILNYIFLNILYYVLFYLRSNISVCRK